MLDGKGTSVDDAVEVHGLETLWPADPHSGQPTAWRPNAPGMKPEPEMLRLVLRCQGKLYQAVLARSVEGARQAGEEDEGELRKWRQWFEQSPGWIVIVLEDEQRFSSSTLSI